MDGRGSRVAQQMIDIYADLQCLLLLYTPLMEQLVNMSLQRVFASIEMPLARLLSCMELRGLCVSVQSMDTLAAVLREQIAQLEASAERIVQQKFNMASPEQVRKRRLVVHYRRAQHNSACMCDADDSDNRWRISSTRFWDCQPLLAIKSTPRLLKRSCCD